MRCNRLVTHLSFCKESKLAAYEYIVPTTQIYFSDLWQMKVFLQKSKVISQICVIAYLKDYKVIPSQ